MGWMVSNALSQQLMFFTEKNKHKECTAHKQAMCLNFVNKRQITFFLKFEFLGAHNMANIDRDANRSGAL